MDLAAILILLFKVLLKVSKLTGRKASSPI
jgi:hypothetical protein